MSSSFSFNASQSAYQVYSASQYLDKFIFTDANGKLNQPPTASDPGLYLGSEYLGYYNGTGTSGWKTYMDNQGDFYLTSSTVGGGFLAWDSSTATLQIQGAINIQGGNAATTTALSSSLNAVSGAINSATASLSTSVATTTFTTATGLIAKPPGVLVGSPSGLYLGSTFLGYYNGSDWKTYMANNGNFFLSGTGNDSLTWNGSTLIINGAITVTGGNAATSAALTSSLNSTLSSANSTAAGYASNAVQSASVSAAAAQTAAQLFATSAAGRAVDSGSAAASAAQTAAINQAKTDASASVNLLANGNWTGGSGTFITATSISSPVIAGNGGYISGLFVVGNGGAITLDGVNKKMYIGTGTYSNTNTAFYVDNSGRMSLKDKFVWDGNTLSITGNLAVGSSVPNSVVSGLGALALKSSVTAGTADVSGFGGLATKSSVGAAEIDAGAVTETKIGTGAVSNAKIAADAVTEGKIATDAVTSGKISANAITAGKIAADAVTADKIAAGSITATKITAGAIEADKIAAGAITAGKISAGAIEADKIAANAITADKIGANEITATKIASLSFSGKTATFDQGSVGGWTMDGTGLYKTTGNFTLRLGANAQRISISEANAVDTIDRVRLDSSTDIPIITVSDTGSLYWSAAGQNLLTVYDNSNPNYAQINTDFDTPDGSPSHPPVSYVYGIIGLIYAAEEIWIESEYFPNIDNTIVGQSAFDFGSEVAGYYNVTLRVRKFPTSTDALNETSISSIQRIQT